MRTTPRLAALTVDSHRGVFLSRVLSTYGLTLVIAALLVFGVDRLEVSP
jgi:hypothetical protein